MVGTKLRTVQWPSIDSNASRGVNIDRYHNKGLGGQHSMESYQGDVVFSGNEKPHKCLKTFSHKTTIQTFSKIMEHKAIHLPVDNMVALTQLLKTGGTQNLKLVQLAKEMQDHLLQCGITFTVESLPSKLNVTADLESRNNSNSSEWKLAPESFQKICQVMGAPQNDLFVSGLSHQIKIYFLWKPDPLSQAADVFQVNWFTRFFMLFPHFSLYAFPPFPKVFRKVLKKKVPMMMILATRAWPKQLWYPETMRMSIQQPTLLTQKRDLLKNPKEEIHPLVQSKL